MIPDVIALVPRSFDSLRSLRMTTAFIVALPIIGRVIFISIVTQ